ncbi:MAG: adenylate kinase family protein [Thermoplasmatota archaeon]
MKASITGTPGVGKTSAAKELEREGYSILDLNEFIKNKGLREDKDEYMESYNVDIDKMIQLYKKNASEHDIVEGHLSHHLGIEPVIVLRCSPVELKKRASSKDWPDHKLKENVEAEAMDVVLIEALNKNEEVYEIDVTDLTPKGVKEKIIEILNGDTEKYTYGKIDWTEKYLLKE